MSEYEILQATHRQLVGEFRAQENDIFKLEKVAEKALFFINTNWMRYEYPVREEEKALTELWDAIEDIERARPADEPPKETKE
jgi:hypothetical protein